MANKKYNNMKNWLLIFGLSCITFFSKAQTSKPRSNIWVNGGLSYAALYEKPKQTQEIGIPAPEAGLSLRVQYPNYWGFEVGGYYSMKGVKFKNTDTKVTLNYAGMFANGLLFFPLINNNNIYIGGGLYILEAFDGKAKSDSASSVITFGDTWKRFDAGIELRSGYNIKDIVTIGLHYDLGAFKTYSSTDSGGDLFEGRNSVITLFVSIKLAKISVK